MICQIELKERQLKVKVKSKVKVKVKEKKLEDSQVHDFICFVSEKWRQKLQALLYDYRHSASDRALEHQVKISFCLSRKIVRKKLDDVGQCREGK